MNLFLFSLHRNQIIKTDTQKHQNIEQIKKQAKEAFTAFENYQNADKQQFQYNLDITFHNLDILRYNYQLQCLKLKYQAVLAKQRVFLGQTQQQVDQLLIMNNNFNERSKQAKEYDLFVIDYKFFDLISIKCGKTFIQKANILFVKFDENDDINIFNDNYKKYLNYTNVPQITGNLISVPVGVSGLTPEQVAENIEILLDQIIVPCQTLKNIASLSLRRVGLQTPILPIYNSILKPGVTFIKEEELPADEELLKLCKEVKEQNGLI